MPKEGLVNKAEPIATHEIRGGGGLRLRAREWGNPQGPELLFVHGLSHLPPNQRAVLIMRDVLGFSAREVAESLETSVASVNSAAQRARKTIDDRLPASSQQVALRELGDDGLRELVRDYVAAWERRDIEAMVAMLAEDATFAMPPHPHWFRGRDAVIEFVAATGTPDLRHLETRANAQPALGWYLRFPEAGSYVPVSLEVLAVEKGRVREITAFTGRPGEPGGTGSIEELFERFGLPARLPASGSA